MSVNILSASVSASVSGGFRLFLIILALQLFYESNLANGTLSLGQFLNFQTDYFLQGLWLYD